MTKTLTIKIFFGLLCLMIIAATNNSAAAQRKGSGAYAATLDGPVLSRSEREQMRRRTREAAERARRREAAERRRSEARQREYARRKRIADASNKRKTYGTRLRRSTRRSEPVYQRSGREIQVITIPNNPN